MDTSADPLISDPPPAAPGEEPFPDQRTPNDARLLIRAMRPTDADALRALHSRLSPESRYLRFFSPHPTLSDAEVTRFTTVDGTDRLAVVAIDGVRLVGVARADRLPETDRAEVALVVDDGLQHEGVGTALLERLVHDANLVGVRVFEADTLLANGRMLSVFSHLGFPVSRRIELGVVRLAFPITPTAAYDLACRNRRSTRSFDDEPGAWLS